MHKSDRSRPHSDGALLVRTKRGRRCTLAKVVRLRGELVIGMPYERDIEAREFVSLPKQAIEIATQMGARRWVLRFASTGMGYSLAIEDAVRLGNMRGSDGMGELFVKIAHFQPCPWPNWAWVPPDAVIDLDAGDNPSPSPQGTLFGDLGEMLS
jgi:hypothetical protein